MTSTVRPTTSGWLRWWSKSTAKPVRTQDGTRETVESICMALVLAILFRAFASEAFIIPTGSMAPTLMGRHKDVTCPQCGHQMTVGASDELEREFQTYLVSRVRDCMCVNCRHEFDIYSEPVFKGDRILVNKFPYELGDPDRWDVVVFRYPEDPQTNYIKRLVGLPGEQLRIARGDVYARTEVDGVYKILRKQDPSKQLALQQIVYDDTHPPRKLLEHGWPERWMGMDRGTPSGPNLHGWVPATNGWKPNPEKRTYTLNAAPERTWLRYQHLVPTEFDWSSVESNNPPTANPRPQLVTDFCGYNTATGAAGSYGMGPEFWVGDLTLTANVVVNSVDSAGGELVLELNEGVRVYQARISLPSGEATFVHNDDLANDEALEAGIVLGKAMTPIKGAGRYRLVFANVDDRLCLWVNGSLVPVGSAGEFSPPANPSPQAGDLVPVGIAARGLDVEVGQLLVQRDIYYRADMLANSAQSFSAAEEEISVASDELQRLLTDPRQWGLVYQQHHHESEFETLAADEFFVMGDNSPRSADSRLWPNSRGADHRFAVQRSLLLGKAFFVFWPHAVPFLNNGKGYPILQHPTTGRGVENYAQWSFPFYPQFWRMQRIR